MTAIVVTARIAGHRVAFDAAAVEAVVDVGRVVPAPLTAPHVLGLAAARSRILTVIDGAAAVGLPRAHKPRRTIVAELDGHRYAIAVDSVDDVAVPTSIRNGIDPGVGAQWRQAATAIVDTGTGFALLLDPARVIAGPAD